MYHETSSKLPNFEKPELISGELGEPFLVLSISEIRQAEECHDVQIIQTADGPVHTRPGDLVVSMPNGERYPISSVIYFGTYEVLGMAGRHLVGRRLYHARFAWEVMSSSVEITYGQDRGTVSGNRGDWIYQSDDSDYGLINAQASTQSYVSVGSKADFDAIDWSSRTDLVGLLLNTMAPVLTFLALLSYSAYSGYLGDPEGYLGSGLLLCEALLILLALAIVFQSRKGSWSLKKAVERSFDLALYSQDFAEAIGERGSALFPNMVLWRAVQRPNDSMASFKRDCLENVKDKLNILLDNERVKLEKLRNLETLAHSAIYAAGAVILLTISVLLFFKHSWWLEIFAIWLPSVVAALHSFSYRKNVQQSIATGEEFVVEMAFVKQRLTALTHAKNDIEIGSEAHIEVSSVLRLLCKCIAQVTQGEVARAAAGKLDIPV